MLLSPTQAGGEKTRLRQDSLIRTKNNHRPNHKNNGARQHWGERTWTSSPQDRRHSLCHSDWNADAHACVCVCVRGCEPGVHSPSCQRPPTLQCRVLNDLAGLRAADPTDRPSSGVTPRCLTLISLTSCYTAATSAEPPDRHPRPIGRQTGPLLHLLHFLSVAAPRPQKYLDGCLFGIE